MAQKDDYYTILTAAINDIAGNGYDSVERIAYWQRRLKKAAERTMASQAQMEQMLRGALASIYKRMIEQGKIVKYHGGISRFTLEKVRPQLRAELDRRILAAADLIKLNRQQAMEQTLRRFSGWATSIPIGGSDVVNKVDTKTDIRKSMRSLPFTERRVIIDQSQKLFASLNDILATDGGAIAAVWRHVHQANYDGRPEHIARDGKIFVIRDSWAAKQGLIRKGPNGYTDEIDQPAEKIYCKCRYIYLYALRDLPDEFLTAKGRAVLAEAKAKIKEMQ